MGTFKGTTRDLETIIQSLRPSFGPDDYNVITKNCNHFANEFMVRLIGQEIPAWVNRMANFGSVCACMLPDQQANNSPVNAPPDSSSGFYTRPGRLATHQSTPQTPSSSQASTGRRLGASSELPVISQSTATGGYHPVATTDSVHEVIRLCPPQ